MNWFERYSISGAYFITLITAWLYLFTYDNGVWGDLWIDVNIKYIVVIGGALVLPLGYIVSIFAQYLYYKCCCFRKIHKESIKQIESLRYLAEESEDRTEAELAVRYRLTHITNDQLERLKWLEGSITKRWDVIAINQILMVVTVLAPIISVVVALSILEFNCPPCNLFWFLAGTSIVVFFILCKSQRLLSKQLIRIYQRVYQHLEPLRLNSISGE